MAIDKFSFGISSIDESSRASAAMGDPQLAVKSSEGSFQINMSAAKAIGIEAGDYIMFFNNIGEIEKAISMKNDDIITFASENGKDLDNREDVNDIVAMLSCWYVAKGIAKFKPTGENVMHKSRASDEEVQDYKGCKTSAMSSTGLTFSSISIWHQLKGNLKEPSSVNRIFKIDVDNKINTVENNGYENIPIEVFPLEFEKDLPSVSRKRKIQNPKD